MVTMVTVGTAARRPSGRPILPLGVNLASLALLSWGVASQLLRRAHSTDHRVVSVVLLAVAVASWVAWAVQRTPTRPSASPSPADLPVAMPLAVMALAGGALAAFAPLAIVFPAVAALGSAMRWRIPWAAVVGAAGWSAMAVAAAALGASASIVLGGAAAILAGLMVGFARRQSIEREQQAARMELEVARTDAARARAELLAERNHLARELHDVLAHTLAALSLQLEAFETVVEGEPGAGDAVRQQLQQCQQLVREGLREARGAVQALRDDLPPLSDQLARLCESQHAALAVSGPATSLPPPVVLGLYRVAQEGLTNAVKHAPGATASVRLEFGDGAVSLTVENGPPPGGGDRPSPLAATGAGYGLRGLGERLALVGGRVEAGPRPGGGWRVAATVPTLPRAAAPHPAAAPGSGTATAPVGG